MHTHIGLTCTHKEKYLTSWWAIDVFAHILKILHYLSSISPQIYTAFTFSPNIRLPPSPLVLTIFSEEKGDNPETTYIRKDTRFLKASNSPIIKKRCSIKCSHTYAEYFIHHLGKVLLSIATCPCVTFLRFRN